jgi:hypothetical protein
MNTPFCINCGKNLESHNFIDSFKTLDRKTEFLAQNISLSSSTCMGAQKHEKFAMLSFKADGHKYAESDIEKVFDVFLDKEQLEYIVETAKKFLKDE